MKNLSDLGIIMVDSSPLNVSNQAHKWDDAHTGNDSHSDHKGKLHTPFTNGAKELQEAYTRLYNSDYKKANCNVGDFEFEALD